MVPGCRWKFIVVGRGYAPGTGGPGGGDGLSPMDIPRLGEDVTPTLGVQDGQ